MANAEINTKAAFTEKIKNRERDQLLIFSGNNSQRLSVIQYRRWAMNEARKLDVKSSAYDIYTINIDKVKLSDSDQNAYQLGNSVICCTTINEGEVSERAVAPRQSTLRRMVRNIFF